MAESEPIGVLLGRELIRVLRPLAVALAADEPVEALLQVMADAFVDGELTFGLERIQQMESSLRSALAVVEALDDRAFEAARWPDTLEDILAVVGIVKSLGVEPELPDSDIGSIEAVRRLVDHLLGLYLIRYRGALYGTLSILQLVSPPDPVVGRSFTLHFDRVAQWIQDPAKVQRDLIGWGTPSFVPGPFVGAVAHALNRLGLATRVAEEQLAYREPDLILPPPLPFTRSATVQILSTESPVTSRFGLVLQASPASEEGDDAGFALAPFGNVADSAEGSLGADGDWRTRIELDGRIAGVPFVSVRPGRTRVVEVGAARLGAALKAGLIHDPTADSVRVIDAEVLQVDLGHPMLLLDLKTTGDDIDLDVRFMTTHAFFTVRAPGGDGFLGQLLPEPLSAGFSFEVGWGSTTGFYIGKGKGLRLTLPLSIEAGSVLRLDLAQLSVEAPGRIEVELGFDGSALLGPLGVTIERLGVVGEIDLADRFGAFLPDIRFLPPSGAGISFEVGPVGGGGFVSRSDAMGRYVGGLELDVGTLALTAFGIIDADLPDGGDGFSMLVLVTGRFTPIPIGFGFTLNAVGGLLGIHRDVDVDALFAAIRAGTARDLLAPEDPVRDAPRLARRASAVFPVTRGQHVFGPTVQLGWGSPKQVITLDLGLAVTLPDPLRFILIGTVRAVLPDEKLSIARLNVDIAGVLDLSASRFDLEGRIYDSVIQALSVTGGFAMRSSWGRDRSFAFSIGGLHPGFDPPANFPTLDRMGVDLSRGSSFQFRLGGYFAITSNSLQLGARADLKVRQAGFSVLADVGFDALFIFDPFGMDLRIYAGASIKRGSTTLFSLRIRARLRGPGPWRISGSVSFSILFIEVSIGISKTFGREPSELAVPVDGASLLAVALAAPRSWVVEGADHGGDVVLDGLGEALGPYSPLAVQQKLAPLELHLDQLGGRRLDGPRLFRILRLELPAGSLDVQAPVTGAFAPAQFVEMTEKERLAAPAFEDLVAGASFAGDDAIDSDGILIADTSMEMIILDAPPPSRFPGVRLRREMAVPHQMQSASRGQTARVPAAAFMVRSEAWVATDGALGAIGASATHAELNQSADGAVLARAGEVST